MLRREARLVTMGFAFCSVCRNDDSRKDGCTNCGGKGFVQADTRGRSGFHGAPGVGAGLTRQADRVLAAPPRKRRKPTSKKKGRRR